jgi:hypothetical protein
MEQSSSMMPMTQPSIEFYTKRILSIYDIGVLGFSNTFVWHCPTRVILQLYRAHISSPHLDIGVGTGYFLDHCTFLDSRPSLTLLDLNPNSLAAASRRLRRYQPTTVFADVVTAERPSTAPFGSIGINYVLHCLPGSMDEKSEAFGRVATWLAPGGTIFGSTILGTGVNHGALAHRFLDYYNRHGVFGNRQDSLEALTAMLRRHCRTAAVRVVGSVALFVGRR